MPHWGYAIGNVPLNDLAAWWPTGRSLVDAGVRGTLTRPRGTRSLPSSTPPPLDAVSEIIVATVATPKDKVKLLESMRTGPKSWSYIAPRFGMKGSPHPLLQIAVDAGVTESNVSYAVSRYVRKIRDACPLPTIHIPTRRLLASHGGVAHLESLANQTSAPGVARLALASDPTIRVIVRGYVAIDPSGEVTLATQRLIHAINHAIDSDSWSGASRFLDMLTDFLEDEAPYVTPDALLSTLPPRHRMMLELDIPHERARRIATLPRIIARYLRERTAPIATDALLTAIHNGDYRDFDRLAPDDVRRSEVLWSLHHIDTAIEVRPDEWTVEPPPDDLANASLPLLLRRLVERSPERPVAIARLTELAETHRPGITAKTITLTISDRRVPGLARAASGYVTLIEEQHAGRSGGLLRRYRD